MLWDNMQYPVEVMFVFEAAWLPEAQIHSSNGINSGKRQELLMVTDRSQSRKITDKGWAGGVPEVV